MVDIHEVAPYHPDADRFAHEPTFVQARVGHGSDDAVMVQFAEELIQRALSRHGDELRFFLAQPCSAPDTWSSLCAGTDSPSLGIEYVRQAVCKLIPNRTWVPTQTYAAEHNPQKRKFIQCVHAGRLSVLFGDIFEIVDGRATSWDYVGGRNISRPSAKGKIGGFPCQDASVLNFRHRTSTNRNAIADNSLRTGKVFNAIVAIDEDDANSEWAIYENVVQLAAQPQNEEGSIVGPSNLAVAVHMWVSNLFWLYWDA